VNSVLHPEANAEFLEAQRYYAAISPELGNRFYEEVSVLLLEAGGHPLRYRMFDPPARRLLVQGFPYAIVYVAQNVQTFRALPDRSPDL